MSKVIIYANENGGVSVTIPTGELSIQEVLTKDCPENAIIVDELELPQGDDANYFDAWVLNNGVVTVNIDKKNAIQSAKQKVIDTKASAIAKLSALGLTQDEVKSLIG
jgi:hypothetical protein